ncbi:MAG: mismatch-specific DNA-glycosylase [Bacilli bacterium]
MKPIPDRLRLNLQILFVGFNPSIRSSETGHHYANPNNRFWTILFQAGITSRKYLPEEDELLLELGIGFTNIVARPTRAAEDISKEEYNQGRLILLEKIAHSKPKTVCFVGKGVYQQYSNRKEIPWGVQHESIIPGVIEFVAPSSSGLVRMKLNDIVSIYQLLTSFH